MEGQAWTTGKCFVDPEGVESKEHPGDGKSFLSGHQDKSDPNTLILFEGYSDDSALSLHRNAGYYIQAVVHDIRPLLADRQVILTTPLKI